MGELLSGIDFKSGSRKYTKTEEPISLAAIEAEIARAVMSEAAYDAIFPTLYESSIGYVAPENDPA